MIIIKGTTNRIRADRRVTWQSRDWFVINNKNNNTRLLTTITAIWNLLICHISSSHLLLLLHYYYYATISTVVDVFTICPKLHWPNCLQVLGESFDRMACLLASLYFRESVGLYIHCTSMGPYLITSYRLLVTWCQRSSWDIAKDSNDGPTSISCGTPWTHARTPDAFDCLHQWFCPPPTTHPRCPPLDQTRCAL